MPQPDFSPENEQQYEELVVSIEASEGIFSLLIAACDDQALRERIIQRYERELFPEVHGYRLRLNWGEPSLRQAIADWAEQPKTQRRVVLSVTGAEELLWMNLRSEDSSKPELDKFFGYLQWTREGVGQYPYPVVLWVTHRVLQNLGHKAPDFWSWRKGVFRFSSPLVAVPDCPEPFVDSRPPESADDEFPLSVEDLQELIATTEQQQGTEAPSLATLYDRLALAYKRRISRGESTNLAKDQSQAIQYFNQAIVLQTKHGLNVERLGTLICLGNFHGSQSRFQQALADYQQALELARKLNDRWCEAASLNNLGNIYSNLAQYKQAINLHQRSLKISREIDDRQGEAASLSDLGSVYRFLGEYNQAIDLQQQALEIDREIGDRRGEAVSLSRLGNAYSRLNQYPRAIDLHQQALEINREVGDRSGESESLCHLGWAYLGLWRYQQALELFQQALEILKLTGQRYYEASSWEGLGDALAKLDRKFEARSAFETARKLYEEMGLEQGIKDCSTAIYNLEGIVPVAAFSTPRPERYQPKPPRWRRKLLAFSQRLQQFWRWLTQRLHR